jgi:hypothetical protein
MPFPAPIQLLFGPNSSRSAKLCPSTMRTQSGPVLSHVYPPRPKLDGPFGSQLFSAIQIRPGLDWTAVSSVIIIGLGLECAALPPSGWRNGSCARPRTPHATAVVPDRAADCQGSGRGGSGVSRVLVMAGRAAGAERGGVPLGGVADGDSARAGELPRS